MRLDQIFKDIPNNRFRVFYLDNFSPEFFIVGDYEAPQEAIAVARAKEKNAASVNGINNEIVSTFYVIDNRLNFLYGIPSLKKC